MTRLIQPGRLIYAIGIMALGILSIMLGDFKIARPPDWPAGVPGEAAWAYIGGAAVIIGGLAILFNKKGGLAALVIGLIILIASFLLRNVPSFFKMSGEGILWSINAFKTLALAGGGLIVAASFFEGEGRNINSLLSNERLKWTGIIFVAYFLILCGFSHFKYTDFILNGFIPDFIPFHKFWTYFCGVALIAGGIGIIIPPTRKLAALLSGIMVMGWFLLLHIPRYLANTNDPGEKMGVFESFAIAGILFVIAGLSSKKNEQVGI